MILKSSLCDYSHAYLHVKRILTIPNCDYSDAYIHVRRIVTIPNTGTATDQNNRNKKVILEKCASFTDCINEINNTKINNVKDNDVVMPMYYLIEYINVHLKISSGLWRYYEDWLAWDNDDDIEFLANNNNI